MISFLMGTPCARRPGGHRHGSDADRHHGGQEFSQLRRNRAGSGTLHGKEGTFVLQHSGTMTRGAYQLIITVVPDSGIGELAGLTSMMDIIIADGKHSYDFDYTPP
jgi:Protein of unknown function (DUF3224)